MEKAGMVGTAHELENMDRSVDIGGKGIAQIGIEVGQAGAVDDEIKVPLQVSRHLIGNSKAELRDIALDNLDFFAQESGESAPILLKQRVEDRRFLDHLLKPALRRI